jgi:hypothetical protein
MTLDSFLAKGSSTLMIYLMCIIPKRMSNEAQISFMAWVPDTVFWHYSAIGGNVIELHQHKYCKE